MYVPTSNRQIVRIVGGFVFSFTAFVTYSSYANWRGQSQAEELCASIRTGESLESARSKMKASSAFLQHLEDKDYLSVAFKAAWVERDTCIVNLSQGKVVRTEIFHND